MTKTCTFAKGFEEVTWMWWWGWQNQIQLNTDDKSFKLSTRNAQLNNNLSVTAKLQQQEMHCAFQNVLQWHGGRPHSLKDKARPIWSVHCHMQWNSNSGMHLSALLVFNVSQKVRDSCTVQCSWQTCDSRKVAKWLLLAWSPQMTKGVVITRKKLPVVTTENNCCVC